MIEILNIKWHSSTQLTRAVCWWMRPGAHTHTWNKPTCKCSESTKGLLTSPQPSPSLKLYFLHFALNTDSYGEPGSALQGAVPQRATISLLVNKSISNNPWSLPLCLDRPAQPRRGCFVREGGEWQTTWAPLHGGERRERVRKLEDSTPPTWRLSGTLQIPWHDKRYFEKGTFSDDSHKKEKEKKTSRIGGIGS